MHSSNELTRVVFSSMNYAASTHRLYSIPLVLREADKPAFADAIWNLSEPHDTADIIQGNVHAVCLRWWSTSLSYTLVSWIYLQGDYVKRKYKDAIVVFDGYSATNTRGVTHQRWTKGKTSMTVTFTADMCVKTKKNQFLANKEKKQRFFYMLREELQKMNCETHHAS